MFKIFSQKSNSRKKGACSLVFDDGYKETLVNVLPILKKYNLKATFAFAANPRAIEKTEKIPTASLEIAEKIKTLGHEIASHSVNHVNLKNTSDADLEKELKQSHEVLKAKTIVYPGGAFNKRVIETAKKYYLIGRGVEEELNHIPPIDFFSLKSFVPNQGTNWNDLNKEAKRAARKNLWLIESYHLIASRQTDYRFTVTPEAFEEHLQKLIELNLWIAPLVVIGEYILEKTGK
ncbi:MAG: polysaccharide deacetylase family protein [Patescibacteria group bacterium]|nr:polysaccharide deacetylase family protein [Patescibacteria group bacterium]